MSALSLSGYFLMEHMCTPPIVEDGDVHVCITCCLWLVHIFHIDHCKPSDLEPAYTVDAVHQLHGEVSREVQANALLTFHMHVRATHATCHILEEFHLNHEAFEWVLDKIEVKFNHTLVNPGGMCSTVAAQSIGEPATQMTLNTFHYASVSSKNATLSVPCLKEIINIATNIKTLSPSASLLKVTLNAFHHAGVYNRNAKLGIPHLKEIINITMNIKMLSLSVDLEIESKLHLQSPWHLWLALNHARKIDWSLAVVTGHIAGSFKMDLFVVQSKDNLEKWAGQCIEASNMLGIAVAHAAIMKKVQGVIKFGGSYMNYCHLSLFCNLMTHCRTPMEITPHGINHTDIGTLASLIGGETVGISMEAAGHH
ncbi:hypothetical protein F5J12DRAFT_786580 [Pisolithus orientalis]|uniref:uncharacterized protein n=1 Tax=Pisolithus orientalis TaxID=936130 RepID=UPI0022257389|nr:uncharacterized protein F5J12DRAFT_786580 [Pisolithus orientalis]KAI5990054.1 hypothetical protein F5J12DRAFT_786580 [Pisolithus orientalis]